MGINFLGHRLAVDDLAHLPLEFFYCHCTSAGHGLIARGENPFHLERLVQRIERHERHGRRAIRVGDDTLVPRHVAGVDLRDDQRDRVVHAERARVVDDDTTGAGREGSKFF